MHNSQKYMKFNKKSTGNNQLLGTNGLQVKGIDNAVSGGHRGNKEEEFLAYQTHRFSWVGNDETKLLTLRSVRQSFQQTKPVHPSKGATIIRSQPLDAQKRACMLAQRMGEKPSSGLLDISLVCFFYFTGSHFSHKFHQVKCITRVSHS